jgi:hypothetical protein
MALKFIVRFKGSSKSGNYGHAGIPGHRGGSAPKSKGGTGGVATAPKQDAMQHTGVKYDKYGRGFSDQTRALEKDIDKLSEKIGQAELWNDKRSSAELSRERDAAIDRLNVMLADLRKNAPAKPAKPAPKAEPKPAEKVTKFDGNNGTTVTSGQSSVTIKTNINAPRQEWVETVTFDNSKIPFISGLTNGKSTTINDTNRKPWVVRRVGQTAHLEKPDGGLLMIPWNALVGQ